LPARAARPRETAAARTCRPAADRSAGAGDAWAEGQALAAPAADLPPALVTAPRLPPLPSAAAARSLADYRREPMMITSSAPGDERAAAPVIVVGGGQSGLAAARALRELRMPTVILEASDRPTGSWPRYYDSLRLFSPAGYSSMAGMPFPGAPDRYPGRDEVADYLERYAARLDVEIQTNTRVETIQQVGRDFIVFTDGGRALRASGIVAASGSFSNPYRPSFPGELSHVADYRNPVPYAGQRVIVVGAGDSAAHVANELAPVAAVTLATRH